MAIIIPSKNIYDKKNPKIINNVIDNVRAEIAVVKPNNEYETPVYNTSFSDFEEQKLPDKENFISDSVIIPDASGDIGGLQGILYTLAKPSYISKNIEFNLLGTNKWISEVFTKIDKNGNNNIKISLFGKKNKQKISANISGAGLNSNQQDFTYEMSDISYGEVELNETGSFQLPKVIQNELLLGFDTINKTINANISLEEIGNISSVDYTIEDDKYKFLLSFLSSLEFWTLKTRAFLNEIGFDGAAFNEKMDGYYEKYEAEKVEITFYGNTIGISLEDGTVTYDENGNLVIYGNGDKPFSLSRNELIQDSSKTNDKPIAEHLSRKVLEQYENGKETAELLCSISEYYDENGNLVISTKNNELPMMFEKDDVAIPMTFSPQGEDVPMSRNKEFTVVGVEPIYDGAVWQRLTLQEK